MVTSLTMTRNWGGTKPIMTVEAERCGNPLLMKQVSKYMNTMEGLEYTDMKSRY